MQSILRDIKEQDFKQIYLLYGIEDYLRKQYRDKLKNALLAEGDTMNYQYYEGKDINVGALIDQAETMPFFADRRVLVIENSELFKRGGEQLAEYLANPAETAYFIFVETEIDKRSKLFKSVRDNGRAIEFTAQDEQTLKKWIRGLAGKDNKRISEDALNVMLEKTGTDMENVRRELEKLICYCLDREEIRREDVEEICITRISNRIFDMINAIADKQQKTALKLYYDLLELKEPPMRILFLITRQFNLLLQVKELKQKGFDNKKIGEKTGLHSFIVGKYVTQAGKFNTKALRQALTDCVEADESVKMGRMIDKMCVELLIVKYSS